MSSPVVLERSDAPKLQTAAQLSFAPSQGHCMTCGVVLQVLDFLGRKDTAHFKHFVGSVRAGGGYDKCEDVAGALQVKTCPLLTIFGRRFSRRRRQIMHHQHQGIQT